MKLTKKELKIIEFSLIEYYHNNIKNSKNRNKTEVKNLYKNIKKYNLYRLNTSKIN